MGILKIQYAMWLVLNLIADYKQMMSCSSYAQEPLITKKVSVLLRCGTHELATFGVIKLFN